MVLTACARSLEYHRMSCFGYQLSRVLINGRSIIVTKEASDLRCHDVGGGNRRFRNNTQSRHSLHWHLRQDRIGMPSVCGTVMIGDSSTTCHTYSTPEGERGSLADVETFILRDAYWDHHIDYRSLCVRQVEKGRMSVKNTYIYCVQIRTDS